MEAKKRNPAADIIRCLAFFFVVSVHFLLNNGFYDHTVDGEKMFIMTQFRALFIICVPLFLTLSGYLLKNKMPSRKYYSRIVGILITYLLASLFCMGYSALFLNETYSLLDVVTEVLGFSGAPYAWYVEMYLGLFLLIPFLNVLYKNLPSKKWKTVLIISLIIVTSLPDVVNVYNFDSLSWWLQPSSSGVRYPLLPDYWREFYPITYYFLGCYLNEYGLKIKKSLNLILIILWVPLVGLYSYWRSYGGKFVSGPWGTYCSLFNLITTVLVFTLIVNFNYEKFPSGFAKVFKFLSPLCLGAYLVSWVFDSVFYPILAQKVPLMPDRLPYYFIIVPLVFLCSLTVSFLLSKIQFLLEFAFAKCKALIVKK
ncbi:MAG: acyltransferase family protein [Clostridia bacterium]|nr:acyltransferase family protein [Clostridia bacterium]